MSKQGNVGGKGPVAEASAERLPALGSSLLDANVIDPYPVYDTFRQRCPVGFDDRVSSWVVSGDDECRRVLETDLTQFKHADQATDPFVVKLSGGARQLKFLYGDDHHRVHHWWLRAFSPKAVATMQPDIIRPIVDAAIDRFIESGRAELWSDLAVRIPVRAIAAVMDLPFDDEDWVETIAHQLDLIADFFDQRFLADERTRSIALGATETITKILLPTVRSRREGAGADMISRLWADGPNLLEEWSEEDVITQVQNMFVGGKDTTTLGIANALHLLLSNAAIARELTARPNKIEQFVEESLRLEAPVQFRVRVAAQDVDLKSAKIRAGDTVIPVLASAGRDADRWGDNVNELDLDRPLARTHLAFLAGPRTCVGAALARAEMNEVVRAVLARLPDLILDQDSPPPAYVGRILRAHRPLHVTFTPGARCGQSSTTVARSD